MTYTDNMQFTRNMQNLYKNEFGKYANLMHCREDFETALEEFENAGPDTKMFNDLYELCKDDDCRKLGITPEALQKDHSLLLKIPTRAERQDELLASFYAAYRKVPTPQQYMDRLTAALAPQYKNDAVRLRILKKFLLETDKSFNLFKTESFIKYVLNNLTPEEKAEYQKSKQPRTYLIDRLDETIFNQRETEYPDSELLKYIIQSSDRYIRNNNFPGIKVSDTTEKEINDLLKETGISFDGSSLKGRLELLEKHNARIKDQSRLHTCIEHINTDYKNQLCAFEYDDKGIKKNLYDDKFDDALRRRKNTYKANHAAADPDLLDLCDDLANGKFIQGETKRKLYYFAFIFRMLPPDFKKEYESEQDVMKFVETQKPNKFHCKDFLQHTADLEINLAIDHITHLSDLINKLTELDSGKIYHYRALLYDVWKYADHIRQSEEKIAQDTIETAEKRIELDQVKETFEQVNQYIHERDLEKNLFYDYYNDNIIRYLEKNEAGEKEPDGRGINPKNYSEAIYLYYLYHAGTLQKTPGELLQKAEDTIKQCAASKDKKFNPDMLDTAYYDSITIYYADYFVDKILAADENELPDLICEHYETNRTKRTSRILIRSENNTANGNIHKNFKNARECVDGNIDLANDAEGPDDKEDAAFDILKEVNEKLREKYKGDSDFYKITDEIENRIKRSRIEFYLTTEPYERRMLIILWILKTFKKKDNKEGNYFSPDNLEKEIEKHETMEGYSLLQMINTLEDIGYRIVEQPKASYNTYRLNKSLYKNRPELKELLDMLPDSDAAYNLNIHPEGKISLLDKIIKLYLAENGDVTRTGMLLSCFQWYITNRFDEANPSLDDFVETINDNLTVAGFQPLSSKNLFDLYLFTVYYFYVSLM